MFLDKKRTIAKNRRIKFPSLKAIATKMSKNIDFSIPIWYNHSANSDYT